MSDTESIIKGLTELAEYLDAKMNIAGIGKGAEVFGSWYRAANDAIEILREHERMSEALLASTALARKYMEKYKAARRKEED